jgi:photosystem II stability/assembly factor-like uncharacterized protein
MKFIIILFLLTIHIYPQWYPAFDPTETIHSISFVNEQTGMLCGAGNLIMKTTDGGKTWKNLNNNLNPNNLYSIYFRDNNITVVGGDLIASSTNAGITWNKRYFSFEGFRGVYFISPDTGIVVGYFGKIYRTVNGGVTWSLIPSGTTKDLRSVNFSDQNGTIVGDGIVLRSSDSGLSWFAVSSPVTYPMYDVFFINKDYGFIAGNAGCIAKTTDGGSSWSLIPGIPSVHLRAIYFSDSLNGLVSGENGYLIMTSDGGNSWTKIESGTSKTLNAIYTSGNISLACGASGLILRTSDGGITWEQINKHPYPGDLLCAKYLDESNIIIGGTSGTILKSVDGGENWDLKNSGNSTVQDMYFFNKDTGIAVGGGEIKKTTDGGDSWMVKSSGHSQLFAVYFSDLNNGTAVGLNGSILRTTDGGEEWISQSSGTTDFLFGVYFSDANTGIAVGGYEFVNTNRSLILLTSDGGNTWNQNVSNYGYPYKLMKFSDTPDTSGMVVGFLYDGGYLDRSTDNGLTWIYIKGLGGGMHDLTVVDNNELLISGYQGRIARSTDGGVSFNYEVTNTQQTLYGISFLNSNRGIAVGSNGVVLLYKKDSITTIRDKDPEPVSDYLMLQNYPNPFNPSTKIIFNLPDAEKAELKIYNIMGEEIETLLNAYLPEGKHEISWDAANSGSGVYFAVLKTGRSRIAIKMVKLK